MHKSINKLAYYSSFIVLALLIYFPLFGYLNYLPLQLWDESRLAVNAIEMLQNKNWLVTYFEGSPDLWNTKPPLLIWLQVLSMKLGGISVLSFRLPSALAALGTCILILIFCIRYLKDNVLAISSVLVLITSQGYISLHVTRTGDYDSLLVFFLTASCLLYYSFLKTGKKKLLTYFFVSLTLGVLTKGIAGLMFAPGLLIFGLLSHRSRIKEMLKSSQFYIGIVLFLVVVVGYYYLREMNNPGYLAAVSQNELGGRFFHVVEEHKENFWYYFDLIRTSQFGYWNLLIPCGALVGILSKRKTIKDLSLFLILLILQYFLLISSAKTKLEWYDAPLYPFLAITISIFITSIFTFLKKIDYSKRNYVINPFPMIFLFLVFVKPYNQIFNKTYKPRLSTQIESDYYISYYLKRALNHKYQIDNCVILKKGNEQSDLFYVEALNIRGYNLKFIDSNEIKPGQSIIVSDEKYRKFINDHYNCEKIQLTKQVYQYNIHNAK